MRQKRSVTLVLLLTLVVLAAAAGWLASDRVQSPAEAAARTAPPTPSPILAPLEERVLSSAIITRGAARFGLPQTLSLTPSGLKKERSVVTVVPQHGQQINEGDVLLAASGRPVFVLLGESPVYRDLSPGFEGQDVQQLEKALVRLGFTPGAVDGLFDAETATAIADWYVAAGWTPFGPTAEQRQRVHALEDELVEARNALATAQDALAAAPLAVEAAQAQVELAVVTARATAEAGGAAPDSALADAATSAARLQSELLLQEALGKQRSAQREAERWKAQVARIEAELTPARLAANVQLPADEFLFAPTLPMRVDQVNVAVGEPAQGDLLTVTNNQLFIDSALPLDEAPLVQPGMQVLIDERTLGIEATGVIARVADAPGTDGVDGFHIYFETSIDETDVALQGYSLRLTIPVQSTDDAVLVAPISALSMRADGVSYVQADRNGVLEPVPVEVGLTAEGFVEIHSLGSALAAGQLVLIGVEHGAE